MTGYVFDVVSELFLFGLVPLFLTVATVWSLWHVLEKINPDEVTDIESFLTFIVVVVPFVLIVYFGLAVINYDEIAALSGWPLVLPLDNLLSPLLAGAVAFYIGQTMWLWRDWRKLRIPR